MFSCYTSSRSYHSSKINALNNRTVKPSQLVPPTETAHTELYYYAIRSRNTSPAAYRIKGLLPDPTPAVRTISKLCKCWQQTTSLQNGNLLNDDYCPTHEFSFPKSLSLVDYATAYKSNVLSLIQLTVEEDSRTVGIHRYIASLCRLPAQ